MKPNHTKPYPRALPFQPPPELEVHAARLTRWTLFLAFAVAFLMLAGIGAYLFLNSRMRSANEAPENSQAENAKPAPEKPASPQAPKLDLANLSTQPSKPTSPAPPALDAKHRERFLEALGGLSAAHLYQSYLNIGLVADAVENEAYSKSDAAGLLQTIGELVTLVDNHLNRLSQVGLDSEDQQAIDRIRSLAALLRVQSNSLLGYWATGDMDHVDRYHLTRERTWTALKDMLGIQE